MEYKDNIQNNIKNIVYDEIDITLDIYCTEGYIYELISTEDLDHIHTNTDTIKKIDKELSIDTTKMGNFKIHFTDNKLKDLFIDNKYPLSLTIHHFIKLIANSKINDLTNILDRDKQNGVYINMCDEDNDTLLHFAVFSNNYDIVNLFLKYGADPNKTDNIGQTPIYRIVFGDNDKIINLLLKNGADINLKDKDGNTPLHIAVLTKNYLIVKAFLINNADVHITNNNKLVPLDYATTKKDGITETDEIIVQLFMTYSK
jgi:ankyrin repeat protein